MQKLNHYATHTQAVVMIQSSHPEARTRDTRIHSRVRTITAEMQVTVTVVANALEPLSSAMVDSSRSRGPESCGEMRARLCGESQLGGPKKQHAWSIKSRESPGLDK